MSYVRPDPSSLAAAREIMVGILDEFVRICARHNLRYWLDSGTLLGAWRHQGFIPWDDDVDVSMPREDYIKFLLVAPKELSAAYFLQTKDTDSGYFYQFIPCKIRCNDTDYIHTKEVELGLPYQSAHSGIFIDIRPFDKYVYGSFMARFGKQIFAKIYLAFKLSRVRECYGFGIKRAILWVASLVPEKIYEQLLSSLVSHSMSLEDTGEKVFFGHGYEMPIWGAKMSYKDLFPLQELTFEGKRYAAPRNTEKYLELQYGLDYMSLPPEDKRKIHAYKIVINREAKNRLVS